MADDEKPRATLPSEAVRSPPQQNSTTDPPTAEAVKRVVEEIHAAEGYRFPQPPLSNTDADNPEWVGTVRIPSDFHPAPQTGSVEFKAGGGTPNATGDDTDEGLRALQKIARDRADLDRQLTEAAKPLADAAARLRENAAGQWEDYARRQTDRNLRYRAAVEREDKQDRQEAIADAIEQSGQSREKAPVAATEPISKPEKVNERGFNVALTTYGAMFGTGLLQLAARDWYFGPIFTIGGGLGLMSIHPRTQPKLQAMRSPVALWAMITVTWLFLAANIGFTIYGHYAGQRPAPTGRIWETLTKDQKTLLALALRNVPKRDHFRIICLTSDCKDLAADFMGVMHEANWNPIFSSSSSFFSEPYGLVIYQKDVNDRSIADAIEKTTNLKVDHIEATNDPTIESIFLGLRP